MQCQKCGTQNNEGAKFCIGCGNPLGTTTYVNQNPVIQEQSNIGMYNSGKIVGVVSSFNPFLFLMKAFIKPIQIFKEKAKETMDTKNSIFLGGIVTILAVLVSLINKVISTVRTTSFYGKSSSWNWDNLNGFPWFKVLGKDLLLFAGIVFGIALLFYLAGLIIKKDTNYLKMLSITAVSFLPALLGIYVLGPLLGMIWDKLSIVFPIIGICYAITILSILINMEIQLEGDQKIYFNFICFSILFIVLFFVIYQMKIGSALDTLSSGNSNLFS